jgi:ABC-type proline/glycine betaine transport system permease subunit
MITARQSQEKAYQKHAWVILFALSILLVVNIVIVAGIADHANQFQRDTGIAWEEFVAAYPSVANAYVLNQRLLYVGFMSLALFALIITYFGFRQGHRWAWFAMWLFAAALGLTAILFTPSKRLDPGVVYAAYATVTVIGLLLPVRKFFPGQSIEGSAGDLVVAPAKTVRSNSGLPARSD